MRKTYLSMLTDIFFHAKEREYILTMVFPCVAKVIQMSVIFSLQHFSAFVKSVAHFCEKV